jgi:hypothetical protein
LIKKTKKYRANSCDEFCKGILDKEDDYNESDNQDIISKNQQEL